MLQHIDITRLASTVDGFKIPRPMSLKAAETLQQAAVALQTEVYTEVEPNSYDVAIENLRDLHAALVAWPSHAGRAAASDLLVQRAEGKVSDEWTRFAMTLFESFRGPFDKAAARYAEGDEKSLPALTTLARARDILANVHKATTLRTPALETSTRVLRVVSVRHALYLVTNHTRGLERYTPEWFAAVRGIDGVCISWQSVPDQEAMDKVLPQEMRTREGAKVSA
jgi:hypothetical protein